MDPLMKEIYKILGVSPVERNDNCVHGNDWRHCLTCEKQEERRQEAREVMEEYRRAKDGE
jgi:hypothetical protein